MTFWYGQVLDRIRSIAILFFGFIVITTSCSCTKVGTAIGAGARAGLAIAEERSIRTVISDTALKLAVNKGLVESSFENLFWTVKTTVFEGRVLLTGGVETEQLRDQASEIVWAVDGVREVLNELQVVRDKSVADSVRDKMIVVSLHSKIAGDKKITGINYKIVTYNRTIYLIGVAQTQGELDRVVTYARSIRYVRRLVNYVLLVQDERRAY
jgi:osmotically-inducible protein OsmY